MGPRFCHYSGSQRTALSLRHLGVSVLSCVGARATEQGSEQETNLLVSLLPLSTKSPPLPFGDYFMMQICRHLYRSEKKEEN